MYMQHRFSTNLLCILYYSDMLVIKENNNNYVNMYCLEYLIYYRVYGIEIGSIVMVMCQER